MQDDKTIIQHYWDRDERALTETDEKYGGYCYTYNAYTSDCTGKQVKLRGVTANDVQEVKAIIESVSKASSADSTVQKIINEQLDLFIADAQSAEETAKNVQSKVSLYLKEIK